MTTANGLAVLAATTALAVGQAGAVAAQEVFAVEGDTFVTNGSLGLFLFAGDTLIVREGGSITVSGEPAMQGFNESIRLENRGAVMTSGADAYGQYIFIPNTGAGGEIDNSGAIETGGDVAFGQYIFGTGGSINNSGTIVTTGGPGDFDGADGQIISGADGRIENSGTITTSGDGANGQYIFGNDGIINNSGVIKTTGDRAITVSSGLNEVGGQYIAGDRGRISNTGTIVTQGANGHGQYIIGADADISNSGSIDTKGEDAFGQYLSGNSGNMTNSGWLVSAQSAAITVLGGSGNTINLLAPGFIGGAIDFEDADNTAINVVTGPSQSILWTLAGDDIADGAPNISGTVPWFYNASDQSVATFDPTLLAVETAALGDLTSLLSRLGLGALDGPDLAVDGSGGLLAYWPESDAAFVGGVYAADPVMLDQAMALDAVPDPLTREGWATVFGGLTEHEGGDTTIDADTAHLGFAAGYTWRQAPGLTLNAMAGYTYGAWSGDSAWSPSFDHDTHTGFAGLHGEQALDWGQFGDAEVRFGVTAGYIAVDHNRLVNDNLAPLGESWVGADYGGFFVSPEIAVSTDIAMANDVTLTPTAGLRYAALWLGGYTETGAVTPAANATVEARMVGMVEARAELAAARAFDWGSVSGRIGYLGRFNAGDDATGITLNTVTQDVGAGFEALNALYVGGGARRPMGAAGFVALDGQVMLGDTARGVSGSLTAGMTF